MLFRSTNAETRPERPQKVFPRDHRARHLFHVRRDPVRNAVWGHLRHQEKQRHRPGGAGRIRDRGLRSKLLVRADASFDLLFMARLGTRPGPSESTRRCKSIKRKSLSKYSGCVQFRVIAGKKNAIISMRLVHSLWAGRFTTK